MTAHAFPSAELLARASTQLASAGIDSAPLDAELLLEHVTRIPRLRRRILAGPPVPAEHARAFHQLVDQRAQRIPLQHLVGTTRFLDLDLRVSPDVLIPRPETEQLVLLAARCADSNPAPRILDIGTGSGCIATTLARLLPKARITAVDISHAALDLAQENARTHGAARAIEFLQLDAFASGSLIRSLGPFDLVVTNPPYIPTDDIPGLQPEVRDHDPRTALDGGPDGLQPYRHLAVHGADLLTSSIGSTSPMPRLLAEFGDGQASALIDLFLQNGWTDVRVEKDLSGTDRILIVRPPVDPLH